MAAPKVGQFLITTPAGHILLDTGFESSVSRLKGNVAALGYRFEDVKIVVTSHAHIDHVQAHALVRRTHGGAGHRLCARRRRHRRRRQGRDRPVYDGVYSWAPCPVDREVADGDRARSLWVAWL